MMWSWKDKITPAELVEHIDMLLTLLPSELKEVLKTRDLPVSGTKEDLQKRLLNLLMRINNLNYPLLSIECPILKIKSLYWTFIMFYKCISTLYL